MRFVRTLRNALISSLMTLGVLACGASAEDETTADVASAQTEKPRVAVLLASHGDIDDVRTELESYVKLAFLKNVGIPLPGWIRGPLAGPAYALSVDNVRGQYERIGPTRYRANSLLQANAVEKALSDRGLSGKVYLGFNFTSPLIGDTLAQIKKDGFSKVVVFNKGAQYSFAASGENIEDVEEYLKKDKDWKADVLVSRQYSDDPRFRQALADAILGDLQKEFGDLPPKDVCVLVASHGLPQRLIDMGDPAIDQMVDVVKYLRTRLTGYRVYHGYLNDDFFPGAKWVSPKAQDLAKTMKAEGCVNVLMDGRLSFTTHHRATQFDLNVEARSTLESSAGPNGKKPRVVLAPNFDDDPQFAKVIADLTAEALEGKGDLDVLRKTSGTP